MKFIEAMRQVAVSSGNAMRRPEMAGYVKAAAVARSLTASVVAATFGNASTVNHVSGTYYFSFNGTDWIKDGVTTVSSAQMSSVYGITVTGTPYSKDSITISYSYVASPASETATASVYKTTVRNMVFTRWDLEDPSANVTEAQFSVSINSDGDILDTGPVVIVTGSASVLAITSYLMTAMLATDWFLTTVAKSEKAYTGGTLW